MMPFQATGARQVETRIDATTLGAMDCIMAQRTSPRFFLHANLLSRLILET